LTKLTNTTAKRMWNLDEFGSNDPARTIIMF